MIHIQKQKNAQGLLSLQTLKPRKVLGQKGINLEKENINEKFT